jgi:hypothetical protein
MPKQINSPEEIKIGDFYEDCGFQPCLCVEKGDTSVSNPNSRCVDSLRGISLVTGKIRMCSAIHCGIRLLTLEEAIEWKLKGPSDWQKISEQYNTKKFQKWWIPSIDFIKSHS